MSEIPVIVYGQGDDFSDLEKHLKLTAGSPVQVFQVDSLKSMNERIKESKNEYFVLVNPNLVIRSEGWLFRFNDLLSKNNKSGIVGGKVFDARGLLVSFGRRIVSYLGIRDVHANIGIGESDCASYQGVEQADSLLHSLCMIKKRAFDEVGGFDENLQLSASQPFWLDDFCMSIRAQGFNVQVDDEIKLTLSHYDTYLMLNDGSLEQPVDDRTVNLWRKKWRWHPDFPDLHAIRDRWGKTEICWNIGNNLLDEWDSSVPEVDILMVTRNNHALLKRTLKCLAQTDYENLNLYILLNGPDNESKQIIEAHQHLFAKPVNIEEVKVNMGLPAAFNWLLSVSSAPLVVKLDDDVVMKSSWLQNMVRDLQEHPYAGVVGAKIVRDSEEQPSTLLWANYRLWPQPDNHQDQIDNGQFDYLVPVIANMGCALLYRRKAIEQTGALDISLAPVSWDDLEHQLALWARGYDVLFDGRITVQHPWKEHRDLCRRSRGNMMGNGMKVRMKWGVSAFEVVDRGLDMRKTILN